MELKMLHSAKIRFSLGVVALAIFVSCCLNVSQSREIQRRSPEPDSASLYDNIYSAISEFSAEEKEKEKEKEEEEQEEKLKEKRQISPAQSRIGSSQLPRNARQTNTRKVIVDGFPTGLPDGTPLGVQIALASAQDFNGEMPPIPGQAGVDYPVNVEVPLTSFDCNSQNVKGLFADTEADCQVFHICQVNGNANSFLCPNGTIFNQEYFICDWWYNVDCSAQPNFYNLNELLFREHEEGKKCTTKFCQDD